MSRRVYEQYRDGRDFVKLLYKLLDVPILDANTELNEAPHRPCSIPIQKDIHYRHVFAKVYLVILYGFLDFLYLTLLN